MSPADRFLNPSEAAKRLGVSAKALRLYEQRGLIAPIRTTAGWRVYGPDQMARAAEIVALRELGLSLGQVTRVIGGDPQGLEMALAAHQNALEGQLGKLTGTIDKVRRLRADLRGEKPPTAAEITHFLKPEQDVRVALELPWPWGGERFELQDVRALNYIIGPLGSGKTRLAKRLAEALPDATFLGMDRLTDAGVSARARLDGDPARAARVEHAVTWLVEEGASVSDALLILLTELAADSCNVLVIDMLEQGLDKETQEALIAFLRHRGPDARSLFILTRSSAILDLDAVGPHETITLCPANHSPPTRVAPFRGAPGYEAVATCLATPDVRARTEGVIAWRPEVA
ncbi:MAG: MerR family transcriptional regulator [Hyphomicrobiaceae bacterium]